MYKVEDFTLDDLKTGNDAVFKKVYESNRDKFIHFAKRYQLPHDDVIDAYQDAYIAFYNNIISGKVKELTSSISTYLFSIGKFIIYDKLKKNKKTINPEFDLSIINSEKESLDEFTIEPETLTAEQMLLQTYFKTLGNKCKQLLTLFYYRGYTIQDILELGDYNSENVIKSTKSRCMKTLKERIKSDSNG